jgi:hypothetical protein
MRHIAQILGPTAAGEYVRSHFFRATRQVSRSLELLRLAIDEHPEDDALRTEYLRGWFAALASEQAEPDIAELAKALEPRSAAVLAAARHAVKNEWREVALADQQLAQVSWTDTWYPEAVELRANWRLRVTSTEKRRFADEALVMLDRLAIMSPTLSIYGLRTRAGISAERPEVVLESLSNYARLALGLVRAGVNTRESMRAEMAALLQVLDTLTSNKALDAARIAEVRAEINQLQ